jgi:hypothetical protein
MGRVVNGVVVPGVWGGAPGVMMEEGCQGM